MQGIGGARWRERVARWGPTFLGAAAVRVLWWVAAKGDWTPRSDQFQYWQLSRSLADGDGFSLVFPQFALHPTAFRPPLYPLLLTPGAWLFPDALWPARLLNVVIGSLVVVLAGAFAARVAGRRAGLAAAGVVAVYPPLVSNDTVMLTEPLALLLLLGALLLLDEGRWAWAGATLGLLLLTRPNGYLVVAIAAVWAWRRFGTRPAIGLLGCCLLVVAPWMVRNRVEVDTWRLTTSDGLTLVAIYGEPAQARGTFVDPVYDRTYSDLRHRLLAIREDRWNAALTEEALDGVRAHPGYVWTTVARNARAQFEVTPSLGRPAEISDGRNLQVTDATRPLFFVVSALGLVGLARRRHDGRVLVLAVVVAQFVVLCLLLVAPPRLRAPFDLACGIGVGLLVAEAADRRTGTHPGRDEGAPQGALEVADA